MAKWRLTQPHYINIPGTEWEYKETDRNTGRQARKVFAVPTLLDPNDPAYANRDGEIIVVHCDAGNGEYLFDGDPTPDMEPLDDEAKAISEALSANWVHPIEGLSANGDYGAALVAAFEKQIAGLSKAIPTISVPSDEVAELRKMVADLTARLDAKPATAANRKA